MGENNKKGIEWKFDQRSFWLGASAILTLIVILGINRIVKARSWTGNYLESQFYSNKTDTSSAERFAYIQQHIETSTQFVTLENGDKIAYLYKPKVEPTLPNENRIVIIIGGLPGIDPHWAEMAKNINNRAGIIVVHPAGYEPSTGERKNKNIQNSLLEAIPKILKIENLENKHLVLVTESAGGSHVNELLEDQYFDRVVLLTPMISPESSVNTTFSETGPGSLPWLYNLTVTPTPPLLADARNLKAKEVVVSIGLRDKLVSPADQLAMVERLKAQSKAQVFAVVNPKGDHYTFDPSQVSWWILGGDLSGKTQNQILKPEVKIK